MAFIFEILCELKAEILLFEEEFFAEFLVDFGGEVEDDVKLAKDVLIELLLLHASKYYGIARDIIVLDGKLR